MSILRWLLTRLFNKLLLRKIVLKEVLRFISVFQKIVLMELHLMICNIYLLFDKTMQINRM